MPFHPEGTPPPTREAHARPVAGTRVEAGFPSPADDYLEGALDLNRHLIRNPAATFFLRVSGESMTGAGIFPDDLLVVDRSIEPCSGQVVIAILDGEMTVKRLWIEKGRVELRAENDAFPPIRLSGMMDLDIWGVVKHVIHSP